MGVPVITLAGHHYVSRMSTAVLAGANLNEWITSMSKNISIKPLSCSMSTLRIHARSP